MLLVLCCCAAGAGRHALPLGASGAAPTRRCSRRSRRASTTRAGVDRRSRRPTRCRTWRRSPTRARSSSSCATSSAPASPTSSRADRAPLRRRSSAQRRRRRSRARCASTARRAAAGRAIARLTRRRVAATRVSQRAGNIIRDVRFASRTSGATCRTDGRRRDARSRTRAVDRRRAASHRRRRRPVDRCAVASARPAGRSAVHRRPAARSSRRQLRRRRRGAGRCRARRRRCRPRPRPQPSASQPRGPPGRSADRRRRRQHAAAAPARPPPRYTGHPVSLDFQGADLRAVLRTFAEISGLNIVIDPTIQGTVDVALRDVPWDQALDIILRANKLGYIVDGTIVRIAPLTRAGRRGSAAPQAGRRAGARRRAARADAGAQLRQGRGPARRCSPRRVAVAARRRSRSTRAPTRSSSPTCPSGSTARRRCIDDARRAAAAGRDRSAHRPDDARLRARRSACSGASTAAPTPALGNTTAAGVPEPGQHRRPHRRDAGRAGAGSDDAADRRQPRRHRRHAARIGLALGSVNGAFNLDVALSALERQGQGRLLSTPRVSTQNNVEAEITQGVQIPIQTVANNTVTVTFKDAALTLRVTPQITAANTVIMRISVENASPDFSRAVNDIPPIDTQRADHAGAGQRRRDDGHRRHLRQPRADGAGPHAGRCTGCRCSAGCSSATTSRDESRELLIFITPRIIRL